MTEANKTDQPLVFGSTDGLGPGSEARTLVERLQERGYAMRSHPVANGTIACTEEAAELLIEAATDLERMPAAIEAARMAGVRSVQEQTAVIVRAALDLLESIEGETPFTAEAVRAFKRVFGA